MGLFDKLKKKVLKVDDQQLLLEAMLCVAFADGIRWSRPMTKVGIGEP